MTTYKFWVSLTMSRWVMASIMMVMSQKTTTRKIKWMTRRTSAMEVKKEKMNPLWAKKVKKRQSWKNQRRKLELPRRSQNRLPKKQKIAILKFQQPAPTRSSCFLKLSWAQAQPEQMAETRRSSAWKWKKEAANQAIKISLTKRPNAFLTSSWTNWWYRS